MLLLKVRGNHRIVMRAMVIALGARDTGECDELGFALGAGEGKEFRL